MIPNDTTSFVAILNALGTGQYLAIFIIVTGYLRHVMSSNSALPVTISPKWLPTVSATCGLVYGLLVTHAGGLPWNQAIIGALVAAGTSGFVDGIVVAIWVDASKAPAWARVIAMVVDDFTAPGGGGAPPMNTIPNASSSAVAKPTPTPAARRGWLGAALFAALMITVLPMLVASCAALQAAKPELDVADATCTQLEKQDEPSWVVFTCDAIQIVDGVATKKTFLARVAAPQAASFAAAHAPKSASSAK